VVVRDGLYRAVREAFDRAGIPWSGCHHEDRGDGVFVLVPAEVPKGIFVESLPAALVSALTAHNAAHPAEERIRLRMALHAGEINYDKHGATAAAINLAFRLLDCGGVKNALAESPGVLAVITSAWFYEEVVRHSAVAGAYWPAEVTAKETVTTGWISCPDDRKPPGHVPRDRPPVAAGHSRIIRLAPRYIHGVALPKNWADRGPEIQRIAGLLEQQDVHVLNIVAIGGTGKTSVLRKVADHLMETGTFDALIWFSFYRDEDVERFFLETCRYLVPGFDSAAYESTFERTSLLQETIETRSALIVLDGFEKIVRAVPGFPATGRVSRREMASFFSYVLSSSTRTTVALTSRVRLDEFAEAQGYVEEELPDLALDAAVDFLRSGGIDGPDRSVRQAAMAYGCHALALTVYLDYVRYRGLASDIRKVDLPLTFPAETTLADRLNRLLAHYYDHLGTRERTILNWVSVSPRGLEMREFQELTAAGSAGPGNSHARGSVATDALRQLSSSALVTPNQDGTIVRFDSHPLIKAFCYDRLGSSERRHLHRQLLTLARSRPVPADPQAIDEIQPLLDVFWHALAVDDADTAFSAWSDERVHWRLLWWGSYQSALDLVDSLIGSAALRAQPAQATTGRLLGEAGMLLVKLGQPGQALDAYQEGLAYLHADPQQSLELLLNLSEAQMEVGIFLQAQETLTKAEHLFAEVPGVPAYKLTGRKGQLSTALGAFQDADDLLTEALRQAANLEQGAPGYTCLFLRNRADLRCWHGQLEAAEGDYAAALRHATDPRWRFLDYEGHLRRGLGDLSSRRSNEREANAHYAAALDIARRIGYHWLEVETFAAKARSAFRFGKPDEAEMWAVRGHTLAEGGGWVALAAECLLIRAECSRRRDGKTATEHLKAARRLILRSGKRALKAEYTSITRENL
jgi:tetratricopeptide (TPR) repeat protein